MQFLSPYVFEYIYKMKGIVLIKIENSKQENI